MRRNIFIITAFCLTFALFSCGDKEKKTSHRNFTEEEAIENVDNSDIVPEEEVEVDRTDWMKDDIQAVFDNVIPQYKDRHAPDQDYLIREYCTEDFKDLNRKVSKLTSATGEVGPIDCDIWIMAQDWSKNLAVKVVKAEMLSEKEGVVNYVITNGNSEKSCRVIVKKEIGKWKIDDFQYQHNGKWKSYKKVMKQYVG